MVDLVVLVCVLRATTKKGQLFCFASKYFPLEPPLNPHSNFIKSTIMFDVLFVSGEVRTIRTCGRRLYTFVGCRPESFANGGIQGTVCICLTDLCNGD